MPLTRDLAQFCATLRHQDLPADALPFVRTAFTDTFATLVAGRFTDEARLLREVLQPAPGECRLLVDLGSARPHEAACLNATAAHALDYDDAAQRGHISVVLVPAILAEAEALGLDGARMVTAYAAGYETWAELMRREADHYHNRSWHPTGVFGPIAVAAACASLRGLGAEQAVHALGIAASQAGGLIANFGSMTKPFHAGRASQSGLLATRLAQKGFTATPDVLEHPKGWLRGISPAGRIDAESPVEAGRDWKLPVGGVNVKKYPLCFATHRALDGLLALLQEHPLAPEQVRRITVTISRRNQSTLRFARPQDSLQAKFSMQFAMASALLARRSGLPELRDDFVRRPDVQQAMELVQVLPEDREDPRRPGEAPQDVVQVETTDGRTLVRAVDYVRGGPELPLAEGELYAKFEGCLAAGQLSAPPRPLYDALMRIDALPGTDALYALARS
ncbi:MAG TPA: MmgE/PrpD family protein [Ramlibacter sp.]|nr:MmgE/PrpD family protein [Ramlibacter sp.]